MNKQERKLRNILASNIRQIRKEKDWSQEDLANISSLHRTYIGSVERSERNVTLRTLVKLAKSLNVSVTHLLTKEDSSE